MSDAPRRALRTLLQAGIAGLVISVLQIFGVIRWTPEQVATVTALLTALVTLGQNLLEDSTNVPALLKSPASSGQNPVPDPLLEHEPHPKAPQV